MCWLCGRVLGRCVQWHHTVPKGKGGCETVPVHPICHRAIHTHFTNTELVRLGNDREVVIARTGMAKFLAWVRDKPPDFHAPTYRKR